MKNLTPRAIVKGALAVPAAAQGNRNLIQIENLKLGADWQLTNVSLVKINGFRSRVMEGYCSHQSIEAGQTLAIMASSDPPGQLRIEIFAWVTTAGPARG